MAAPVGVQRTERPVIQNDLSHPPEARSRAFFGDKEHRVMFVRSIVHRYDQAPPLSRYPFMSAPVLVEHHPHPGRTFPALAVRATLGCLGHQPRPLEPILYPAVAPRLPLPPYHA
jgi:hypothetical protein